MKTVALWGKGDTGKSITLKTFLLKILKKYSLSAYNCSERSPLDIKMFETELNIEINSFLLTEKQKVKDYTVTFDISGIKYGLTTCGDDEKSLKDAFMSFNHCDVVFCATRTSGRGVNFVNAQSSRVIWLEKCSVSDSEKADRSFSKIMNYVNEQQIEILTEIFENYI